MPSKRGHHAIGVAHLLGLATRLELECFDKAPTLGHIEDWYRNATSVVTASIFIAL